MCRGVCGIFGDEVCGGVCVYNVHSPLPHALCRGLMEANESYIESTSSIPNSTSSDSTILNQGVDDQIERVPSPFSTSSNNHDLPPTLSTGVEGTQGGGGGNLNITSPQLTVKKIRPRSELMVSGQCDANKNLILRRSKF